MKAISLLSLVILYGPTFIFAQTAQLSGSVKDAKNEPIPFANVFLLQVSDTTMVKGTSADENGNFRMLDVATNTYFIRASYIGNSSELRAISVQEDLTMGSLIIEKNIEQLDEVVVATNRPLVERRADRLLFHVEGTVVSQGSSWDILNRTPGVITTENELQLRNQAATIYINDRKTQLSSQEVRDLLENYPGEHIKLIEVIHNPPARYDADGGPILNIVTSKNISMGYKGNINTTYTQAIFPKSRLGTSHFYKTKNLNLFANYSYGPSKDFKNVDSETNFRNGGGIVSRWTTDYEKTTRTNSHATQLNLDYSINDKNQLSLATRLLLSPNKTFDNIQDTRIGNAQNVLDSTFITRSGLNEDKNNFSADLGYDHDFETNGSLSFNGHFTQFNFARTQDARSDYFDPQGDFLRTFGFYTDADQEVSIFTAQIDLSSTMGGVNYQTGVKGSFIDSRSGIDFFNVVQGQRNLDQALSDDYRYDEAVYAGYFSLNKDWEKLSVQSGIRAELTKSSGNSIALSNINNLEYFELFPTLYLLYTINDDHSLAFDYARKIKRPRYEDLNPFRYFINENNFTEGNPLLVPNFSHNFTVSYTLKGEYFFDLYYRDNGNYISTLAFQDNENFVLRDITQNVLKSTSYGFDFNYGKTVVPWWNLYLYLSIFHEDETFVALESNNVSVTNSVNGAYLDLTNYLTLSNDGTFKGELGISYLSGFLEGSYQQEESTNLTLGLRKSFFNKKVLFSLQASDLLNKANSRIRSRYLNQDNSYFAWSETQYIRFGLTVNFGNFRLRDNQKDIETIEIERLESP